jgi:predicted metal-dependent hydrolase
VTEPEPGPRSRTQQRPAQYRAGPSQTHVPRSTRAGTCPPTRYLCAVSKADRVTRLRLENPDGLDPHYAGWFACFNRGEFYEAHDVLEALWLRERGRPNDRFYKGLIQLAGAFVHLQKDRVRPADALFRLAEANLAEYPPHHESLDLARTLALIRSWRTALAESDLVHNPLLPPSPSGDSPRRRPRRRLTDWPRPTGSVGRHPKGQGQGRVIREQHPEPGPSLAFSQASEFLRRACPRGNGHPSEHRLPGPGWPVSSLLFQGSGIFSIACKNRSCRSVICS